jgi:hypothetical protein
MVVLWGGLVVALGVGMAPAQQLQEVFRGAVNNVPTDMFGCGVGDVACGLTYRGYSATDPSDINGSANPSDGNPWYRAKPQRYLSDSQLTANFPVASGTAGAEWFMVWDGLTGGGTVDHAGWYGTQSQVINFGEIGNSLRFNCLPVIAQEACFGALTVLGFNDTVRADGTPLEHVGGISPIPCPTLVENGLSTITYSWEEATNNTTRDGAQIGMAGYGLKLVPNPLAAPTDVDVAAYGVRAATIPYGTTMVTVDRAAVNLIPGLEGSSIYVANMVLDYAYGNESLQASCNSAVTGSWTLGPEEIGDAPCPVDVVQAWYEIRVGETDGRDYVVITLDFCADVVSNNLARYELFFDGVPTGVRREVDIRAFPASASRNKAGVPVLWKFTSDFDAGDVEGNSSFDDANGRLQVVIDAELLAVALGTNQADIWGDFRLRSDHEQFNMGLVSF